MTPQEEKDLKTQLELVSKTLERVENDLGRLSQQLPSKSSMEGLAEPCRMLHAQRKRALLGVFSFCAVTLGWLLALSLCPRFRPTSWEGLAIALAPALVWLGVGAIVLRWVRAIR